MGMQGSKSLIAGYPFEGTGADVMGSYPLTMTNVTYVNGIWGAAGDFNGTDAYGTNADFIPTQEGTWSIWFNIRAWGWGSKLGNLNLLGLPAGAGSVETTGINQMRVRLYDTMFRDQNITIPNLNEWYHLAVVFGVGFRRYYLNCQLINEESFGGYNLTYGKGIFVGMNYNLNETRIFNGKLDNVKIYNKALTQSEIQRDYLNLPIF